MSAIRRDTDVWRREGNQSVNNKELCSVPDVIDGLEAREEGLSIDVYQTAEHFFDLLPPFWGRRYHLTAALGEDRTGQVCVCVCSCVLACACVCVRVCVCM